MVRIRVSKKHDEEAKLYQSLGAVRYDLRPVPRTTFQHLDRERLENYMEREAQKIIGCRRGAACYTISLSREDDNVPNCYVDVTG